MTTEPSMKSANYKVEAFATIFKMEDPPQFLPHITITNTAIFTQFNPRNIKK